MANHKGESAGVLANRALANDEEDAWDMAKTWTKDIISEVWKCIDHAKQHCPDKEFCVVMLYARDCMIKNAIRRKFYAWPWMPQPRPSQSVWLYRRETDDIQGLWCLPEAYSMARLSSDVTIPKDYHNMSSWCRSFFAGTFPQDIRKQAGINLLTEEEYAKKHTPELLKASKARGDDIGIFGSDPFDFSKPLAKERDIVDPSKPLFV